MKKISKVKSAEIVIAQGGGCEMLECDYCFSTKEKCGVLEFNAGKISLKVRKAKRLVLAEAYLKRYSRPNNIFKAKKVDSYTKGLKKDYVDIKPLEEPKKEIRPNFRQYLRDKVGMKIKLYGNYWMELQQILEEEGVKVVNEYRERNRVILGIATSTLTVMYGAIYLYDKYDEFDKLSGIEYILETDTLVDKVEEPKPIKTVGIDNSDVTLAQHEPTVKENLSVPQPIKLEKPDTVYAVNGEYIKICHTKGRSVCLDSEGFLLVTTVAGQCRAYATPEQALQVAKKQWGVK